MAPLHEKMSLYINTQLEACCVCSNPTSAPAARPVRALCSPAARCSVQPAWRPCPPVCSPWSYPKAGCCGTLSGWMSGAAPSPASPCPAPYSALLQTPRSGSRCGAYNGWGLGDSIFWCVYLQRIWTLHKILGTYMLVFREWFMSQFFWSET